MSATLAAVAAPKFDWEALSPLLALLVAGVFALLLGLARSRFARDVLVPAVSIAGLLGSIALSAWLWGEPSNVLGGTPQLERVALRVDELALGLNVIFCVAALAAILLSWGGRSLRDAGSGELHALILTSTAGMFVLVAAQDLVTLFLGLELLSIPLYILCATELRRATSLESGLKYLVVGSVGSATLLYGLALVYGAAGTVTFAGIAEAVQGERATDVLLLAGVAFCVVGLAFKASVAPFHQWTPDVYEGAPTAITAFMAVATKAAALGVTIRFLEVALIGASASWAPVVAVLAAITIVVGNVGALGQDSVKRILAWSGVAQAGYLLAGVVVVTQLGVESVVFYLAAYAVMNLAAFAVVIARERETTLGDRFEAFEGLGARRPLLAWPMTLAMLSLAGLPLTAGFIGKIGLIQAAVGGDYAWLAVFIVVGSMISLAYYLRIVAAMWMRPEPAASATPVLAGGAVALDSPDAPIPPRRASWEVVAVAVVGGVLTLALGVYPDPLFDVAADAGRSLTALFPG